jgi:aminopeptidase N
METGRARKAQAVLARLKEAPGLSRDVSEIVERTLAAG